MRSPIMKYILMMNGTKAGWDLFITWPKPDLQAHIRFMQTLNKELVAAG